MRERFSRIAAIVVAVGVLQAVVESVTFAVLYRELLFAPYRFFTVQSYDAFTKLYFLMAGVLPLPEVLDVFLAQGLWPKLALIPELVAVNVFVALLLACILAPFASWLGLGERLPGPTFVVRTVVVVISLEVLVHLVVLATSVKVPMEPTVAKVARNLVRAAAVDGVVLALGVAVATGLAAAAALKRGGGQALVASGVAASVLWVLSAVPGGAAVPRPAATTGEAPAAGYNVILISVDSLRADHMSAYGYERDTSPAVAEMAERGVLFRHCTSTTSWTLPAHMSMLTGRSLLGHGVVSDDRSLGAQVPTLAESFATAGYATGAVVSAPYLNSRYGFDRGFDDYDEESILFETNEDSYKTVTAPILHEAATRWIDAHRDRPFFLFLHYWDVHYDYAPTPPYDTMFDPDYQGAVTGDDFYFSDAINADMDPRDLAHVVALYDGEIRMVDDYIGRLRRYVEGLGLGGKTIFVITSDHGDEFFEHGNKGHHRTLFEEVLWVPLVIEVPGVSPAVAEIDSEVSIIDIMPTLLGLVGIAPPEHVEGGDLTRLITRVREPRVRAINAELYREGSLNVQISTTINRKKVIHHFKHRKMRTHDLAGDPGEQILLPNTGPVGEEMASRMKVWLGRKWQFFERNLRTYGVREVEIDEATAETLRSLGYLQ